MAKTTEKRSLRSLALELAQAVEDQFGQAVDEDTDINGGDAVDFIAGTIVPLSRRLLKKGGRR